MCRSVLWRVVGMCVFMTELYHCVFSVSTSPKEVHCMYYMGIIRHVAEDVISEVIPVGPTESWSGSNGNLNGGS